MRAGIDVGLVYLDVEEDDVYGLGANLAARIPGLAPQARSWFRTIRVGNARFRLRARPATRQRNRRVRRGTTASGGDASTGRHTSSGPLVGPDRELEHWKSAGQSAEC